MTDRIEVTLTGMASNGPAIGRLDGKVVFADYGIPGERVRLAVERRKKDYVTGRVIDVIEPDPSRVAPTCQYYGSCGGCQWQHIAYERQLKLKFEILIDQFRRISKLPDAPVLPTLPSPDPWMYRNHVRFSVNDDGELGFNMRRTNQFLRIDHCPISEARINDQIPSLQGTCRELQSIEVRVGTRTGDLLVSPNSSKSGSTAESVGNSVEEELLGMRFRISDDVFFQANTPIADRLVELVRSALELQGSERVVDAYAGVGTFSCLVAERAGAVVAVEEVERAVMDARHNIAANGTGNVEVVQGRVEDVLPQLDGPIDAIVLDPPRTGCDRRVISEIIERRPARIAYVSCDPATLARDVRLLIDGGYSLDWVQPVDQFPQTFHIESVSRLTASAIDTHDNP